MESKIGFKNVGNELFTSKEIIQGIESKGPIMMVDYLEVKNIFNKQNQKFKK